MEIGEKVSIDELLDLTDDCPFDHELKEPPKVQNELIGKGGKLATNMNNGTSTKLYKPLAPATEKEKVKWGLLPQKDPRHAFYKKQENKGRCIVVDFEDGTSKEYPVSCSAHHLIPSQESLKGHEILEYMCKKGSSSEHNHGYSEGAVWSDVGYNTNGSENGTYLPGSYAVGGGVGGLNVWYVVDNADDEEHQTDYIEVDKMPADGFKEFLLWGRREEIHTRNACWHYASKAMLRAPGQFHDRHEDYSKQIVRKALTNIWKQYRRKDYFLNPGSCKKCQDRKRTIEERGLPAPYSIVLRLAYLSSQLRRYLAAQPGGWRENVYTSKWCEQYMLAVRKGGTAREHAEAFE